MLRIKPLVWEPVTTNPAFIKLDQWTAAAGPLHRFMTYRVALTGDYTWGFSAVPAANSVLLRVGDHFPTREQAQADAERYWRKILTSVLDGDVPTTAEADGVLVADVDAPVFVATPLESPGVSHRATVMDQLAEQRKQALWQEEIQDHLMLMWRAVGLIERSPVCPATAEILAWVETAPAPYAQTALGRYVVVRHPDGVGHYWSFRREPEGDTVVGGDSPTVAACRIAAQADWSRRRAVALATPAWRRTAGQ